MQRFEVLGSGLQAGNCFFVCVVFVVASCRRVCRYICMYLYAYVWLERVRLCERRTHRRFRVHVRTFSLILAAQYVGVLVGWATLLCACVGGPYGVRVRSV